MTIDQARRRSAMARWHRRFAVLVSLWLMVLALSGVLINHAHDWGLDRSPLPASLQGLLYGIELNADDGCGSITIEDADCAGVFARLDLPNGMLLLKENSLLLLDGAGQLVEKLTAGQLGLDQLRAGFRENSGIYLRDGQKTVFTDFDLMNRVTLDSQAAAALNDRYWQVRGEDSQAISWERFFLDLHAARFLGSLAKPVNDLMAVLILVLAISGIWLYRNKRKNNGNGLS